MPLDLVPLLDLTPLDEESDPLDDRPSRGEMLEPEIPRPRVGEGPEDIPPGMAGFTPRPFAATPEEFDARMAADVKRGRLGEEIAGTMAEAELTGRAARIFEPNLPRNLLAPTTEEAVREGEAFRASIPPELQLPQPPFRPPLSQQTRESLAAGEALSGTLADLSSADQALVLGGAVASGGLPGAAGRILGAAAPATFGVEGLKSIYEGGKTLLSDDATPEERGQAKVQVGLGASMLPGLGALIKRPAIPPRIIETIIARTEAAVPGALSKSKAALADTVRREPISDQVQQLETVIEKGIPDEKTATVEKPAEVAPVAETAVPREPARGQGGEESQVLLAERVAAMGPDEFAAATRGEFKEGGFTTHAMNMGKEMATPEGIAELRVLEARAKAEFDAAFEADNMDTIGPLSAQKQFFTEALEAATGASEFKQSDPVKFREMMEAARKPDEKAIPAATEAAATTPGAAAEIPARQAPVVEPGVGAVPQDVPAAGAEAKTGGAATVVRAENAPTAEVTAKPSLFREASAQDVDSYVNPSTSASIPYGTPEIYAATSRDLALGQGRNKTGIVVEFDPAKLDVREPRTKKPSSEFVEQQGGGAEKSIRAQPHQLRDKVRSITVPKSLGRSAKDPDGIRLRRYLDQNWSAEVSGDTIIYRPKSVTPEPTRAAAFFERESEAAGLGRSSLSPAVADVRAQRAADVRQRASEAATESGYVPRKAGAGAPPTAPPPSAPSQPAPGTPPHAILDDVYKIFEPAPKEGKGISQRAGEAVESFRTGFSSKFRPLNKLAEDIAKSVGGTSKDVAGIFEQLKGSSGKAEADVYRFDKDVSDLVKGSEKDFNAYVFLRRSLDRLQQDAADIARAQAGEDVPNLNRRKVSQYTIPQLEAKLAALSEQIGGEKLANFTKAADAYQVHMDQALRLQVESGRMSPEVYDAIKEGNQFYAPFKVMKYIEETMRPEGSGRKVDTTADYVKAMEGIEDPNFKLGDMLAAARQNLELSRTLAEKNRAMQNITELAALDVDGNFVRELKPGEDAPSGMEAVNVLENGEKQRYAVNEDVAQAIQNAGPGLPAGIVARWAGNLFRAGATTLNLAFQPVNLIAADAPRAALVSKYGVKGVTDLVRYPMDFVHSLYSSIAGDVFGVHNKLFQDFMDSGAAGATVQQYLTPNALRFRPETATSKTKAIAKIMLNTIPQFANAIEQASKVLGVKRAMRIEGAESGAALAKQIPEAITEIRRFSGSPDFGRSGKWTDQYRLNLVYMFLNARIQGAVADVGRLAGRDGANRAGKTWLKVGTAVGFPTVALYILNNSDEYKKDYDQRPEQEKQNYWLIPKDTFITGSNGEKMRDYWRVPKREIAQWMGNAVESGLDFANQRDLKAFWKWAEGMAESISPLNIRGDTLQERGESVLSGTHPFIKAPIETATGRDTYRHKNIVSDLQKKASPKEQYTDRTAQVFKSLAEAMPDVAPEALRSPLMLENLTRNFTAGLITQFLPGKKPVEGRSAVENLPLTQRFQALPYTDSSEFDQRIQKFERESADEQLKRMRDAKAIMDANKGAKPDALIKQMVVKHGRDPKMAERIIDLYLAEQRGITPQERRILALPVTQRAEYLADELKGKTPEQKTALLRNWALKRILTEQVGAELTTHISP